MTPPGRTSQITHKGKQIVLLDFAGIVDPEIGLAVVAEAKAFIARAKPDGTVLTLTDVTDTRYDRKIVDAFRDLTVHNKPFVKAAAVVTSSSLHRAAISMLAIVSRRRLEVFETRAAAMDWLASQN